MLEENVYFHVLLFYLNMQPEESKNGRIEARAETEVSRDAGKGMY